MSYLNEREMLLRKLSGAMFAAFEMQLFLDTHKNNKEALKSFKEYTLEAEKLKSEYERNFGPLTPQDTYGDLTYRWVNAPWPWETEKEAKK